MTPIKNDLSSMPDMFLINKIKSGEYHYFTPLFGRYQLKVMRLLSRYLDNRADIEDVTQDVFIKVFHAIHDFRGESLFYTWLYRIVINAANNFLNNKNKVHRLHVDHVLLDNSDESTSLLEDRPDWDTPENIVFTKSLLQKVEEVLSRLSVDMREALLLREYDGLSYEEISHRMQCPIGTVRSRIFRGREMLAEEIEHFTGVRIAAHGQGEG